MKQAYLANWLKCIIIGVGICGLIVYFLVVPVIGRTIAVMEQGVYDHCYWPWLIFIWVTGVPCYTVLVLAWKVVCNIGADRSFSLPNAKLLKWISVLAAADAALFFAGNIVFLFLNMNHPGIVLFSQIIVFAGIAVAVAAAALSHLVLKAADLQEQSDYTI